MLAPANTTNAPLVIVRQDDKPTPPVDPTPPVNPTPPVDPVEPKKLPDVPNIKPSDNSAPSKIDVSPIYGNSGGAVGGVNPFLGCTNSLEQNEAKEVEGQKPERQTTTNTCECTRANEGDVDVCYEKVNISMKEESPSK